MPSPAQVPTGVVPSLTERLRVETCQFEPNLMPYGGPCKSSGLDPGGALFGQTVHYQKCIAEHHAIGPVGRVLVELDLLVTFETIEVLEEQELLFGLPAGPARRSLQRAPRVIFSWMYRGTAGISRDQRLARPSPSRRVVVGVGSRG